MNRLITDIDDFSKKKNTDLGDFIESDELKTVCTFLILNEIRRCNPLSISDRDCAVTLSKLRSLCELIDMNSAISSGLTQTEELP